MKARTFATTAGVAFVVLSVWVSVAGSIPYERRALEELYDLVGEDLDGPSRVVARAATAWLLAPIAIIALAIFVARRKWATALLVVTATVLVALVNPTIKQLVGRERPTVRPFVEPVSEYSFPSGHATASMAAAIVTMVIAWSTGWRRAWLAVASLYVVVIAATQLALTVHFPSDIAAGWFLAIGVLVAAVQLLRRLSGGSS
jgi:membrane-associated phospholipid phosphatase